jgi:hypothetical protein
MKGGRSAASHLMESGHGTPAWQLNDSMPTARLMAIFICISLSMWVLSQAVKFQYRSCDEFGQGWRARQTRIGARLQAPRLHIVNIENHAGRKKKST